MSQSAAPQEADQVRKLVAQVDSGAPMSPAQRSAALDLFEQFECWDPYFRLMQRVLQDTANRRLGDYLRLARVQNRYLENVFAAAETCAALVSENKLSFSSLCVDVLPQVVEFEDFSAEATILSAVCDRFAAAGDRVACLERLCMIYEKKTHNESQLGQTYEKLLEADGRNVKALRYFKLVYTQNNDWQEVVRILRVLLSCVTHPQELFRVAQELAAIYLYQLDRPQDAVTTLQTHCLESPLDTSTILFDAYQRLSDWNGCLRVLRECLLTVEDVSAQAVLHFKIASLHEQQQELDQAFDHYTQAANLWPPLYDAIEGAVTIAVAKRDWQGVLNWLEGLSDRVQQDKLKAQLRQAIDRLRDGMQLASPQ